MLRVTETQFAALEAYFGEEFVEQMTRILYSSFPTECQAKPRDEVMQFVRASIERARGKSIGTKIESDFRRYVVTEFILGREETETIAASERKRLLERDGSVDPTILVFMIYQAMLGKITPKSPPPPPQPVYEVIE